MNEIPEIKPGQAIRTIRPVLNAYRAGLKFLDSENIQTRADISELHRRFRFGPNLHPFGIYQVPLQFRAPATMDTDAELAALWRKFRVRSGRLLINLATGTLPTGTDGATNPDLPEFPDVADITVPANTGKYWFWIYITLADPLTAQIKHAAEADISSGNNWDNWPELDLLHIPIGYVDTNTRASEYIATVRQFIRADIYLGVRETEGCDGDGNAQYALIPRTKWYTPAILANQD